jgi:tetratricopeptide (TPR) repeat protein
MVHQQTFALKAPKSLTACDCGKAINHSLSVAGLAALSILSLFAAPAFAGDFEDGCKSYNAKDYRSAKVSFEKVVSVYPKFALGHYYLGNVLLSTGQVAKAKVEYQNCLNGKPDPTTAKYCQAVLAKLGTASAATGVASAPASSNSSTNSGSTMVAALGGAPIQTDAESAAEEKKQAVMAKAEKEIRAYRAEWKRRLEAGEIVGYAASGRLIKHDGTVVWDYHDSVLAVAEKECEEVCDRMRYMAEQQCKFIK